MFVLYIIIIAALLFIQHAYKRQYVTLIFGILLLLLTRTNNFIEIKYSLITLIQKVLINDELIKFIIIISLLYLISELLIILGFQKQFINHLYKQNKVHRNIYMHLLAITSTNFDNTYFLRGDENEDIYNSSSFIMSTLNVLSIPFLTTSFLLFNVFSGILAPIQIAVGIILTNYFAIFWLGKRIIDFKQKTPLKYHYYQDYLIQKETDADPNKNVYKKGKVVFYRTLAYVVIGFLFSFLINDFIIGLIVFLGLTFIDLFITCELFAFNNKKLDEKLTYYLIFNGCKKIFFDVILIILGMMFVILASDLLVKFTSFTRVGFILLFLVATILGSIITYQTKLYTLGLILTLPILSVIFSTFTSPHFETLIIIIYVAIIYIAQHMSILKINFKDINIIIDLSYQALTLVACYLVYFYTFSIIVALVMLVIMLVIYRYLIIKLFKNKTI